MAIITRRIGLAELKASGFASEFAIVERTPWR